MMEKIFVPPIKSQGIKTKLVEWIRNYVREIKFDRWVEPFMGTGVVAFNIRPKNALMCDSNPHLINFYNALKNKEITRGLVKKHLTEEGEKLVNSNGEYYYDVRDRFNKNGNPLDFLFLSRSCFNGMMRFNKSGGFNVPFCRKPNRFAQALVTKIANQVGYISQIIEMGNYTFINQDFKETLMELNPNDLIYCDPPYLGRHVDYFDSWTEEDELLLKSRLESSDSNYILSTWLSNKYRINDNIFSIWKNCRISTMEHFYHIGANEINRNSIYEALLTNFDTKDSVSILSMKQRFEKEESPITSNSKLKPMQNQLFINSEATQTGIAQINITPNQYVIQGV